MDSFERLGQIGIWMLGGCLAVLWVRGRIASATVAAWAARVFAVLLLFGGGGHIVGVVARAVARGKPFDYRLASLITTGGVLAYAGLINLAVSRWIRRGSPWALAVSAVATLPLLIYAAVLHPFRAEHDLILTTSCYFGLLLLAWDPAAGTPWNRPVPSWAARLVWQKLALLSIVFQLIISAVYAGAVLVPPGRAGMWVRNALTAEFVRSPLYAAVLAAILGVMAHLLSRQLERRAGIRLADSESLPLPLFVLAVTALFRAAMVVYLEAAGRRTVELPLSALDLFFYGATFAAVLAGAGSMQSPRTRLASRLGAPAAPEEVA